ncbi:ATP-grasp domain-containing protein [Thioalkalivibrio sp. ALJ15]|uniref:carboxylate--amine ligase n=1 Tax=Thioalkalivibrio sp. ALJ15 TaxID=748652 RepID=UPI001E3016A7|nr:ATP-grasp domain-containing protein [Thioalkalivibrio sp. ALJ15]
MKDLECAFVFNCDYNGLSVIQSLGRRGIPVYALDAKRGIGTRSRYARYLNVPDPLVDERGFVDKLKELGTKAGGRPVLFPTNDHWAESVARNREELEDMFDLVVADRAVVELFLDKERFGRWAMEQDLAVPRVWSRSELEDPSTALPFPLAIKANARRKPGQGEEGRQWARAADALRFRTCGDREELVELLAEAARVGVPVFGQEIVRGRSSAMHSIGVYASDGDVEGLVYGWKVRGFPPGFGDCVTGFSAPPPEWAIDMAKEACGRARYTGLAEFDVMIDQESGARKLIEINPRSWGWIGVSLPAGVDLPWLAYQGIQSKEPVGEVALGCADGETVYYAKMLADLQNTLLWYRFSDARDWVLSPRQWWATFRGKRGVFAEFAKDDPAIAVFALVQAAKQFAGRARRVLKGQRF